MALGPVLPPGPRRQDSAAGGGGEAFGGGCGAGLPWARGLCAEMERKRMRKMRPTQASQKAHTHTSKQASNDSHTTFGHYTSFALDLHVEAPGKFITKDLQGPWINSLVFNGDFGVALLKPAIKN